LIRNLTVSRRKRTYSGYVEVKPEMIILDDLLKDLEIDQNQLICLAVLVGTDYNPKGAPGVGQKTALKIVKEFKTPEAIFESVKEKIEALEDEDYFDWKEIFDLFKKPSVGDFEIEFPKLDFGKIKDILVERHGFSLERIDNQLDRLNKIKEAGKQKSLGDWLIVGVNTDKCFEAYGKQSPIVPYEQRKQIISAFRCVDEVIPHNDIHEQVPGDIRVIGPDWPCFMMPNPFTGQVIKEGHVTSEGQKLVVLPRTPGVSTTIIRERIIRNVL